MKTATQTKVISKATDLELKAILKKDLARYHKQQASDKKAA